MQLFNYFRDKGGNVRKSKYNLSHKHAFDANCGELVPFLFLDTMPGDIFKFNPQLLTKLAPLVAPTTSEIKINLRLFFVPHRLIYGSFNAMYMGDNTDAHMCPNVTFSTKEEFETFYNRYGELYHYFGLPQHTGLTAANINWYPNQLSIMPLRAYNRIYTEYYLDRTLFTDAEYNTINTAVNQNGYVARTVSSLGSNEGRYLMAKLDSGQYCSRGFYEVMHTGDYFSKLTMSANVVNIAQGTTIPDLEKGYSLQRFYRNLIEAKKNFKEYSNMMFGTSAPSEINRPVYIGGSSSKMLISDVTALTEQVGQPLGSYAGKGFGKVGEYLEYKCDEFGYIIGLVDVTPELSYKGALHPRLQQSDYLDFFRPELQNVWVDEIKYKNMYTDYTVSGGETVGAYAPPYNFYRYMHNKVTGRQAHDLSFWNVINFYSDSVKNIRVGRLHDGQASSPTQFDNANMWHMLTDPLFAVTTEPQIYFEAYNNIEALRPIAYTSNDLTI